MTMMPYPGLNRRIPGRGRRAHDHLPPPEPEDEGQSLFEKVVTGLMALITLYGAVIAVLENQVGVESTMALARSQSQAIATFGALTRADERATHSLDVYAAWREAGQQLAQGESSANAAALQGTETEVKVLQSAADRWQAVQTRLAKLTPLLSDEFNGNYTRYYETTHRDAYLALERQQGAYREASDWGVKDEAYIANLTLVTAILFLLGISVTMTNWLKHVFLGTGLILTVASMVWTERTYLAPVHVTPPEAMEHFVDGEILSNIAYTAEQNQEDLVQQALAEFDAALALDEQYADAYQWKGMTQLQTRLLGADPARNAEAAASMEQAIALGNENSVVYTNLGWAYTLAGDYDSAVAALNSAIELEPTECLARLNLGLALLTAGRADESTTAYDEAIACAVEESPDQRDSILASSATDLTDLATVAPETPGVMAALNRVKETSASLILFGQPEPELAGGKIEAVRFAGSVAADGGFVDVGQTFTAGTPAVLTVIGYADMPSGAPWMVRWYRDGELYDWYVERESKIGGSGQMWVRLTGSPMPAGDYTAEVYVGGKLLSSSGFAVQAGDVVAMQPFASSYFHLAFNYPSDWVVTEERASDGYVFASPADDNTRYFWYTAVPWEAGGNESVLGPLMALWYSKHPDLQYGPQGEFYLGGSAQASFIPVSYTDEQGGALKALLVGSVDSSGAAHIMVLQAPASEFDSTYSTVFDPMLRALQIAGN